MQYANSIDDWVRLAAEQNNGAYANSWLLGDVKTGEIARFELGLEHQRLERTRDGWYAGSNVVEDPAILRLETTASYDDVRTPEVARRVRWERLLADGAGKIDVALGQKMLADHFDVYTGRENPSCRTLCGHCALDDGSVPGGWGAFLPVGAFDGKVIDSALARRLTFVGRWGSSCGTPFEAEAFLAAHPQYSWLRGVLRDLPSRPWVELPGGRSGASELPLGRRMIRGRGASTSRSFAHNDWQLVRLLERPGQSLVGEAVHDLRVAVAAGQDHAHVGLQPAQLAEGLLAVHVRHRQVQQDADDLGLVSPEEVDRLAAVAGGQHAEAAMLEHRGGHVAHRLLVVHQQNGARAAARPGAPPRLPAALRSPPRRGTGCGSVRALAAFARDL